MERWGDRKEPKVAGASASASGEQAGRRFSIPPPTSYNLYEESLRRFSLLL
jgi:hypothetical protein